MNFQEFRSALKSRLNLPLPGEAIQLTMAPFSRLSMKEYYELGLKNPRKGAVLILFYPVEDAVHFVLMLRPSLQGVHSDQVSFPGGRFEESDGSLEKTALREAEEEIGISPSLVDILGRITPVYIPVSNYFVQPVIGATNVRPDFVLNHHEVIQIIETDALKIFDEKIRSRDLFKSGLGIDIPAPYYMIKDHKVWGATAMMLRELKEILAEIGFAS